MPGIDSFFTRYCEFCQFVKMTFEAIRGSWTSRLAAGERLPPLNEALSRWPHGFAADGKTSPLQRVFILAQVCPAPIAHTTPRARTPYGRSAFYLRRFDKAEAVWLCALRAPVVHIIGSERPHIVEHSYTPRRISRLQFRIAKRSMRGPSLWSVSRVRKLSSLDSDD